MPTPPPLRAAVIGCGGMARHHVSTMLLQQDTTVVTAVCEPAPAAYEATAELFRKAGLEPPPNEPDFERFLATWAGQLDVVSINTPHAYHHDQARACLEAGLDVLLEKPMVMTAAEAESLIATRRRTGRHLVVAFQGSLSPQLRKAVHMLRAGQLGELLTISGVVWQDWGPLTVGTWRQQPALSGGGFLFDTGAHLLNTVAELAGEDFVEVAAWLDNRGRPVETLASVMARLKSGALVTLHGCGEAMPSCGSDIRVFCSKGILYTGIWGEFLDVHRAGARGRRKVPVPASLGPWQQFVAVVRGEIENPSPPEIGLRMARLWDAIRASAAQNGSVIRG